MKILRVHIENFRIFKEIDIEFSTDDKKNLTVIRAANESGKTNLLNALQWGFFGDTALPGTRLDFRLSPIDLSTEEQQVITISVEIDFELESKTSRKKYTLIRTTLESIQGTTFTRERSESKLFEHHSKGTSELANAEAHLRPILPKELQEKTNCLS